MIRTFSPRMTLAFLVPLALLSLSSCSRKEEEAPDIGMEEPAAETAVTPPPGAMPLSDVLKAVESAGYAPVVAVEFEDDHWELKAYRDGQLLQLKVGLFAGDVLPNPPPALRKPLSEIVKGLEDQGYGPVLDVEWGAGELGSGNAWEIEAYKQGAVVAVSVDPSSGKVTPE